MKHKLWLSLLLFAFTLCPAALDSTIWYVDGVNGSDNNNCKSRQSACKTIGHAISLASSGDSIVVAAATYTEKLTISISLRILGAGAKTTIIDGGGTGGSVVHISSTSADVTLSKLTIQNGFSFVGGGIRNFGTLTITNNTIQGNVASCLGGGGIYNDGELKINNSTIDGNRANAPEMCRGLGGGIYNHGGMLAINNSTVTGNSAIHGSVASCGGGIGGAGGAGILLKINNSTISGNSADLGGGVCKGAPSTVVFQNSIVANSSGGNCFGAMTSDGYNLSSDNTCNFSGPGDLDNIDPKLGTLGNHGGPTETIPLLAGSPAIDAGNPSGCTDGHGHLLKTDQRGYPRPDREDKSGCDMGAYERQSD
jgi:hypothetical protein